MTDQIDCSDVSSNLLAALILHLILLSSAYLGSWPISFVDFLIDLPAAQFSFEMCNSCSQVAFKLLQGDLLWLLQQPLLELHQLLVQVGQRAMLPCQHLSIPGSAGEAAFSVSLLRVEFSTVLHA